MTRWKKIVDSGYIIGTGEFDSSLRELVAKGKCISATRNKDYSTQVGTWVIIFDTKKLTSSYKVVPFCENPDYYLELMKKEPLDSVSKSIRKKDYGDIFWKVKTDKSWFLTLKQRNFHKFSWYLIIQASVDFLHYENEMYLPFYQLVLQPV